MLLYVIDRQSARAVLSVEFQRLETTEEPRMTFTNTIRATYQQLHLIHGGDLFRVLEWLLENYWSHPTLVCMMKDEEIDEQTGKLTFWISIKISVSNPCI